MPNKGRVAPLNEEVGRLESLPQPVVAYGRDLAAGEILPWHHHKRAQLVYASTGVMNVSTPSATYVVPPQQAVWVTGGIDHQIEARTSVAMRTVYVDTEAATALPAQVCVLDVTPLLRELIVTAVDNGPSYDHDSPQGRIAGVILDQIREKPAASLTLPMPSEPRTLRLVQGLLKDPADNRDLAVLASDVGASKRTMTRIFPKETGLSFRDWRQRLKVHRALELLVSGKSVTTIATELGYDNTSAFIAMFRRCLGVTPAQYLQRKG